jgi:hypothetical protein
MTVDSAPASLSIEGVAEAVTSGVLRALAAHASSTEEQVDIAALIAAGGLFGSVVIVGGMWPTNTKTGIAGLPGAVVGGGIGAPSGS